MLRDFLKSTLDFDIVPENHDEEVGTMAPKKKETNHQHMLRTPDNTKGARRSRRGAQTYEQSYRQHLSFLDNTNKIGNYDLNQYPDLMEDGEPKEAFTFAVLDVDQFKQYRT